MSVAGTGWPSLTNLVSEVMTRFTVAFVRSSCITRLLPGTLREYNMPDTVSVLGTGGLGVVFWVAGFFGAAGRLYPRADASIVVTRMPTQSPIASNDFVFMVCTVSVCRCLVDVNGRAPVFTQFRLLTANSVAS